MPEENNRKLKEDVEPPTPAKVITPAIKKDEAPDATSTSIAIQNGVDDTRASIEIMTERDRLRPLLKAIDTLVSNRQLSNSLQTITDILRNDKITIKDKYEVTKILLLIITEKFGVIENHDSKRSRWTDTEYLMKIYQMIQEYLKYFGNTVEEEWKKEMMKRIGAECLKPFDITTPETNEPVWVAEHFDKRIDLAEEINRTVPIANLEEGKQKGVALITEILGKNISLDFYSNSPTEHPEKNEKISKLAAKHDIKLPSRKAVWEKEIKRQTDEISKNLEEEKQVRDLRKLKEQIDRVEEFIIKAISEVEELAHPAGTQAVESIITVFRERLAEITTKNILLRIEKDTQSLAEAIESGDIKRIDRNIRTFLKLTEYKIDNPVLKIKIKEVIIKLEEMKSRQESIIKDSVAQIGLDPNRAEEEGKNLVLWGTVLKQLTYAIENFRKLDEESSK